MAIWVQVRDLPFELKTESMGWSFGDQLGDVIAVSHRNHMIVEKYLRIRVEIPLHEPLKIAVEFTPLGSSERIKYDVRYEKLPLYYECCGIVGHTSERYCSIPKGKRVASVPKNLSVEAYWKGIGASKRAILFAGSSNNSSRAMEGSVVKVTKDVGDLTVTDKVATATTVTAAVAIGGPSQENIPLGQEGRVPVARPPVPLGAGTGRKDQSVPPTATADSGQEGQRMAVLGTSLQGATHGQEGHVLLHLGAPTPTQALINAAGHLECPAGQEGQGIHSLGVASLVPAAAGANSLENQLLFKPGVLEALSGAVAARLAAPGTANGDSAMFTFTAGKNLMQGQAKRKERKGRKKGGSEKSGNVRKDIIGKKRGNPFGAPQTGSDLNFSFEREMDSYEHMMYGEMSVSSKRICMGRVETMRDVDGVISHVAKETEEEEAYTQQRRESVGDDGASAASEEEVRRAK